METKNPICILESELVELSEDDPRYEQLEREIEFLLLERAFGSLNELIH